MKWICSSFFFLLCVNEIIHLCINIFIFLKSISLTFTFYTIISKFHILKTEWNSLKWGFSLNIFPQLKFINLPILFARSLIYVYFFNHSTIRINDNYMIYIFTILMLSHSNLIHCCHSIFFTKKDIKRNKSCCSYILPSLWESFDQMAWFVSELCSFTFHQIQYLFNLSCGWIWIIYQWYIYV